MAFSRNSRWWSLSISAAGLLFAAPVGIFAQTSTAVCLSSFNWMDNSKGQNPCLVSAYLQGTCNGGQFTVNPLPSDSHYTGPYVDQQNECQCSSVTYNTVSACGLCQNETIISWSAWYYNCTTIYPGVFPAGIPQGTAVPAWAFQDVTGSDLFNATLAQLVGDGPESTAVGTQSTATVATASAILASLTGSPSGSSTSSPSSGSSSNTGAIAGGVVGGVVGLALVAGAVVYFVMKNKRSQILPSAQFTGQPAASAYPSAGYTGTAPYVPQMTQPRLYDPSDPSTFPTSPPPATVGSGSTHNVANYALDHSSPTARPGYYSGAPEI